MTTNVETVVCVYDAKGALAAIVKRDEKTGHKLVHVAKEASVEQIAALISNTKEEQV